MTGLKVAIVLAGEGEAGQGRRGDDHEDEHEQAGTAEHRSKGAEVARMIAAVSNVTIGLFAINSHACAEPEAAAMIAKLAESLGYDSLWAGEHVVVPSPRVEPSPMEPDEPILDPLIALAYLAATPSGSCSAPA